MRRLVGNGDGDGYGNGNGYGDGDGYGYGTPRRIVRSRLTPSAG